MLRTSICLFMMVLAVLPAAASELPVPSDLSSRLTVVVLPFESRGEGAERAAMADDYLVEALTVQKRFALVEREKVAKVLLEQKLSRGRLTSADRGNVGKLLAADQVLYGRVEEAEGKMVLSLKAVSTATSAVREYSLAAADGSMRELRRMATEAAARLSQDFPLLQGAITGRVGNNYRTDLSGSGLRVGMDVIVFRRDGDVRHPMTGKSLGPKVRRVATGVVNSIDGKTSTVVIEKSEKGQRTQVGDLVTTR